MTHAQYKARLCTCEHALSRTPTRAIHETYARSQPASQPGISPSPSSRFSFSSSSSSFDAREGAELLGGGGYRIGDRPFFGDPNRPERSYRSLSVSHPPSLPPSLHGNSTKTTRFFPASMVPLRAPLSSYQRVRACFELPRPFLDDNFSDHFSCKEKAKKRWWDFFHTFDAVLRLAFLISDD